MEDTTTNLAPQPAEGCPPESEAVGRAESTPAAQNNFQSWMTSFVVVNFDLELGQTIEAMHPPLRLGENLERDICFHSFPDSSDGAEVDLCFFFRIRKDAAPQPSSSSEFLFGCTLFRRRKDSSIFRGFFQKSLAILSPYPHLGLLRKIVLFVGPSFFEHGESVLESACEHIAAWPKPAPGGVYELPLLGTVLRQRLPHHSNNISGNIALMRSRSAGELVKDSAKRVSADGKVGCFNFSSDVLAGSSAPGEATEQPLSNSPELKPSFGDMFQSLDLERPGLFQDINLFSCFGGIANHLWALWEIVITGQCLLVLGSSPATCSEAVLGLISITSPVRGQQCDVMLLGHVRWRLSTVLYNPRLRLPALH
eukprot:TRINITY_DN8199_c0_g1_i1.p1 TRINITY_DN8199_c0_g1~~TRINITY_DN8199_c0_g1_i1.p1  ORF type:complete len:367 (-),score=55.02 TRINITY_DN8199_c0_g1_i1:314-1414(-)